MSTQDELESTIEDVEGRWDDLDAVGKPPGSLMPSFERMLADALIAEGWRKKPTVEAIVAELDPSRVEGRHSGRNHAGLVLHPKQAEAIARAILALMDRGQ